MKYAVPLAHFLAYLTTMEYQQPRDLSSTSINQSAYGCAIFQERIPTLTKGLQRVDKLRTQRTLTLSTKLFIVDFGPSVNRSYHN